MARGIERVALPRPGPANDDSNLPGAGNIRGGKELLLRDIGFDQNGVAKPRSSDGREGFADTIPISTAFLSQASLVSRHNLIVSSNNVPTTANTGIVISGQKNWDLAGAPYHNIALPPFVGKIA